MTRLTVKATINAPILTVWEAFWKPEHIIHWGFADSETWHCPWAKGEEPKVGGIFTTRMESRDGSFGFDMSGQYTQTIPMRKLSYTMGEMKESFIDAYRIVEISFEETSSGVKITETFDAEEESPHEMQKAGWQMILENMKKYAESLSK